MKKTLLIFACSLICASSAVAQTVRKVDFAKKIAEATPPELPQSPIDSRKGTDKRDQALYWRVKSVIEYTVDAGERQRKLDRESYFNEAGNLTKIVYYEPDGYPDSVTVFGYVDGMRVSRSGDITYADGEKPPSKYTILKTMPPELKPNAPRDTRYQTRHEFVYKDNGLLIEKRDYQNNGELAHRATYEYDSEFPPKRRLERNFGYDGTEWSQTVEILFPSGDAKERHSYDADGKVTYKEINQISATSRGNWTIQKTFEEKTIRGKKVLKPLWTSYRTITYYPDGEWDWWQRHAAGQERLKRTTNPFPQKKKTNK